jgi:hypothetical protein
VGSLCQREREEGESRPAAGPSAGELGRGREGRGEWEIGRWGKGPAQEGGGERRAGRARRWWFGLLSLLFFLSLFYFFPNF